MPQNSRLLRGRLLPSALPNYCQKSTGMLTDGTNYLCSFPRKFRERHTQKTANSNWIPTKLSWIMGWLLTFYTKGVLFDCTELLKMSVSVSILKHKYSSFNISWCIHIISAMVVVCTVLAIPRYKHVWHFCVLLVFRCATLTTFNNLLKAVLFI